MRRAVALAGSSLLAASAALLLLLAADVRRWDTRLAQDDVAFAQAPARPGLWEPREVVPGGAARRLLRLDDDLAFRHALRLFRLSRPGESVQGRPHLAAARDEAQTELARLGHRDADPARRSEGANLLGVLLLLESGDDNPEGRKALESGITSFQNAVRLDDANEHAKFNLELALRRQEAELLQGTVVPRTSPGGAGLQQSGSGY